MNNETAKITVTPCLAAMVFHVTMNERVTLYSFGMRMEREERLRRRREQYCARRNKEGTEERVMVGSKKST